MLLVLVVVWSSFAGGFTAESLLNSEEDVHHGIWERHVKRSAERAIVMDDFAESSNNLLDDIKAYYRIMLDSSFASEEAENNPTINLGTDADELRYYYRPGSPQNRYWNDPAPPFNHKPLQTAPTREDGELQFRIPARYMVMFQSRATLDHLTRTVAVLEEVTRSSGRKIRATDFTVYEHAAKGFTVTLNIAALGALLIHPLIEFIEEDQVIQKSTHNQHSPDVATVQWNLDRLDQHSNSLDGEYNPVSDGTGIDIYILDTGIRYDHTDFNGRVYYAGMDSIDELTGSELKGKDCNGHGTHCAGIAAGRVHGVAKGANIYSLRVLDCNGKGAVSGIVMGIDFLIGKAKKETNRKVMGLSLDLKKSRSLNMAVEMAAQSNIPASVAAGNQGKDSCMYSPSSAPSSISVAATNLQDVATSFSNSGECVDLFAPGSEITSAGYACSSCKSVQSGTSMSAPHVLGASAILLQENNVLTAAEVKQKLIEQSSKGIVDFSRLPQNLAKKTPNRLLYINTKASS